MEELTKFQHGAVSANTESSTQRENLLLYYQPVNVIKSNSNSVFNITFLHAVVVELEAKKEP